MPMTGTPQGSWHQINELNQDFASLYLANTCNYIRIIATGAAVYFLRECLSGLPGRSSMQRSVPGAHDTMLCDRRSADPRQSQ